MVPVLLSKVRHGGRLAWIKLVSILCLFICDEEKKFYNLGSQSGSKKSDGESDSPPPSSVPSPAAPAPAPIEAGTSQPVQRAPQQPPPYTVVNPAPGQIVRGPPPPYPGQNFGPNVTASAGPRVNSFFPDYYRSQKLKKQNKQKLKFLLSSSSSLCATGFRQWRVQQSISAASLQTGWPVYPRAGLSCWSLSEFPPAPSQAFAGPGETDAKLSPLMTSSKFHWRHKYTQGTCTVRLFTVVFNTAVFSCRSLPVISTIG